MNVPSLLSTEQENDSALLEEEALMCTAGRYRGVHAVLCTTSHASGGEGRLPPAQRVGGGGREGQEEGRTVALAPGLMGN